MDRRQFLVGVASGSGLALAASTLSAAESPKALPKRPLGKTGVEVTVLGLGGFIGMKEVPSKQFDPVAMANAAIDAGIRYLDTAPGYNNGQSEKNYGEVLAHRRKEVFLATKTGERTYDGTIRSVEESLKRLRTDRVDLLQVHGARVKEDLADWGKPTGVYRALQKLRDEKVTRFIGVTGHESADVMCQAITQYEFDTILTTFNPTQKRRAFAEKVLPLAGQKQMGIIAMKVMGGALGSLALGNPLKNDGAAHHDDAQRQVRAEALIRYVIGLPISVAIVGFGSVDQMSTGVLAARDQTPFNDPERQRLEAHMNGLA
jgi:aryl-alcohol dehydrogenase-like predicted oxidoreductase